MDTIRGLFGRNKDQEEAQMSGIAKFHGLVNQGATCYLNSVLQVLFMTDDFRESIKSHARNNPGTDHIDRDLTDLFIGLEESNAHTHNITTKLKINNVNEQRDAAEHYEKILRLTSPEASQIFHGELINRNTCLKCNTSTQSEAGFWHLPLPLVDSNTDHTVEKGVLDFFCPSEISGDNQMYCETCDEKSDALLGCEVKHHPEVLVLLLKRFEFDYTHMTYLKNSCVVHVPYSLHIPQDQTYELYALVEHLGEQRFGRYIATIRSPYDGRWYTFEDAHVTESRHQYFQSGPTEQSQTAYLLFYRRQKARFHGLANLGATCYLNSVLQVLFMTDDFRERVRHNRNHAGTDHINSELSDLFNDLENYNAYTYKIIKKLKINNVDEQHDAAEHYEKILRLTSPEASQIFHGELINRNKCLKCNTITENVTGFWHLPLSLVDSEDDNTVIRSTVDLFDRKIQMYCERCDEKCDVVLHCEVRRHPDVLVLLLKRFEYDNRNMRYVKINCAVDVPHTLPMPQVYELYACVEHFGELRNGHYIARIRSKDDGRWYIFDDLNILTDNYFSQEHPTVKSKTAYLLFYRKQKETLPKDVNKISSPETSQVDASATPNTQSTQEEEEEEETVNNMATVTTEVKDKSVVTSDDTKIDGEVFHVKTHQQVEAASTEIGQKCEEKNTEDDSEERFKDRPELQSYSSLSHQTCGPDVDLLADSMKNLSISDSGDSKQSFCKADHIIVETNSNDHNITSMMSKGSSEHVKTEEEIQAEKIARPPLSSDQSRSHEDKIHGIGLENQLDNGACALAETSNRLAFESLMNVRDGQDDEEDEGIYGSTRFYPDPSSVPVNLNDCRQSLKIRNLDLLSQCEHLKTRDGDSVQDQGRTGSEGLMENYSLHQLNHIHDPQYEDFRREEATKNFIKNEEQMKKEVACDRQPSGSRPLLPEYDVHCARQTHEIHEERQAKGATCTDKETGQRERAGQSHKARFDGIDSLGVTREGDTETYRYMPKRSKDCDQQNAKQ